MAAAKLLKNSLVVDAKEASKARARKMMRKTGTGRASTVLSNGKYQLG